MPQLCRQALRALLAVAIALISAAPATAAEGVVRVFKVADSDFDRFSLDAGPERQRFIRDRYDRLVAFAPYFDERTSWYRDALAYQDLYAIYSDGRTDTAARHPEWILRDERGRRLFIPWGCANGRCPQYAGDVGDPAFRRWWIDRARTAIAAGYRGIYVDDANLDMRVSDARGNPRTPVDRRTGGPMTEAVWRRHVADFLGELRRALPAGTEIALNAQWYAGGDARERHPDVRRALAVADTIVLEHGVNDEGLQGGDGEWSMREYFRYVDRRHAEGKRVALYGGGASPAKREYSLAGYLMISAGRDAFGNWDVGSDPGNWWQGLDVRLGRARGVRYDWKGLIRRDFERGTVLMNEPNAPTRRITLPAGLRGLDGRTRRAVTLGARRAVVLMSAASAPAHR